jgi:hypothetical protein
VTLDDFAEHVYAPHMARTIRHARSYRHRWPYREAEDAVQNAALEIVEEPALIAAVPAWTPETDPRNRYGEPAPSYCWLNRVFNASRRGRRAELSSDLAEIGYGVHFDPRRFDALRREYSHNGQSLQPEPIDSDADTPDTLIGPREAARAAEAAARRRATDEQWLNVARGSASWNPALARPPRKPYGSATDHSTRGNLIGGKDTTPEQQRRTNP